MFIVIFSHVVGQIIYLNFLYLFLENYNVYEKYNCKDKIIFQIYRVSTKIGYSVNIMLLLVLI